jgi:hypothetical protein
VTGNTNVGCHPGWRGIYCQECNANILCSAHGTCDSAQDGTCTCDNGWIGTLCDRCATHYYPPNVCNIRCTSAETCHRHSDCDNSGGCQQPCTTPGWSGARCGLRQQVESTGSSCPSNRAELIQKNWAAKSCNDNGPGMYNAHFTGHYTNCYSCTTPGGWRLKSAGTPKCSYSSGLHHSRRRSSTTRNCVDKCENCCVADRVTAVKCKPSCDYHGCK